MNFKNDRGYTLVTVLLVILLLTIIGGSYLLVMTTEARQSVWHSNRTQSYFLARSGAEAGYEWLYANQEMYLDPDEDFPEEVFFKGSIENGFFKDGNQTEPEIDFMIKYFDSNKEFRIESTGSFQGVNQKVSLILKNVLEKDETKFFDRTLFAMSDIEGGKGNAEIYGDVETRGQMLGEHDIIDGELFEYSRRFYYPANFPEPDDPLFEGNVYYDTLNIRQQNSPYLTDENCFFTSINIQANGHWVIDTGTEDNDIVIMVDTLTINSQGNITVEGGGGVYLFIRESGNIQTPFAGAQTLMIILEEDADLTLRTPGDDLFKGYIYGPKSTVTMEAHPNIQGALIVDQIEGNNQIIEFDYFPQLDKGFLDEYIDYFTNYYLEILRWE